MRWTSRLHFLLCNSWPQWVFATPREVGLCRHAMTSWHAKEQSTWLVVKMQLGLLTQEDFHEHELEARPTPPAPRAHPPPRPWNARTAYQAQPNFTFLFIT